MKAIWSVSILAMVLSTSCRTTNTAQLKDDQLPQESRTVYSDLKVKCKIDDQDLRFYFYRNGQIQNHVNPVSIKMYGTLFDTVHFHTAREFTTGALSGEGDFSINFFDDSNWIFNFRIDYQAFADANGENDWDAKLIRSHLRRDTEIEHLMTCKISAEVSEQGASRYDLAAFEALNTIERTSLIDDAAEVLPDSLERVLTWNPDAVGDPDMLRNFLHSLSVHEGDLRNLPPAVRDLVNILQPRLASEKQQCDLDVMTELEISEEEMYGIGADCNVVSGVVSSAGGEVLAGYIMTSNPNATDDYDDDYGMIYYFDHLGNEFDSTDWDNY